MNESNDIRHEGVAEDEHTFNDQLLRLLSDNQVFLNKVQKAQWNAFLLPKLHYHIVVEKLNYCADLIAEEMKAHSNHIPANLEVYLDVSELEEKLELEPEMQMAHHLLADHGQMLGYIKTFVEDDFDEFFDTRKGLVAKLLEAHTEIYRLLGSVVSL